MAKSMNAWADLALLDLVLRSVNFEPYHKFMKDGNWSAIAYRLRREALDLVLKCKAAGVERVILLGTKFTMTEDFMKKRLEDNGLTFVVDYGIVKSDS